MPFDSPYMISYLYSIITMYLSYTVSEILSLISENLTTLRDRDHARTVSNHNAETLPGESLYQI